VSIFIPLVGSQFEIEIDEERVVAAELVEAETLNAGAATPGGMSREPFALLFEVEESTELPQRMYQVSHNAVGKLPLFLVPVAPGRMESVLN
jgi:hypothetical protein